MQYISVILQTISVYCFYKCKLDYLDLVELGLTCVFLVFLSSSLLEPFVHVLTAPLSVSGRAVVRSPSACWCTSCCPCPRVRLPLVHHGFLSPPSCGRSPVLRRRSSVRRPRCCSFAARCVAVACPAGGRADTHAHHRRRTLLPLRLVRASERRWRSPRRPPRRHRLPLGGERRAARAQGLRRDREGRQDQTQRPQHVSGTNAQTEGESDQAQNQPTKRHASRNDS